MIAAVVAAVVVGGVAIPVVVVGVMGHAFATTLLGLDLGGAVEGDHAATNYAFFISKCD